jgi:hypothetical protein
VAVGNGVGKWVGSYPCLSAQKDRDKVCLAKKYACNKSGRWGHGRPHYTD